MALSDGEFSLWDDHRCEIAWRADGRYYAVSSFEMSKQENGSAKHVRRLRTFTGSGNIYATLKSSFNLEPGICWHPKLNLIALSRRRSDRGLDIVFFELNCQLHGEFSLFPDLTGEVPYYIEVIKFNQTGDLLAVLSLHTTYAGACSSKLTKNFEFWLRVN
ncbi:unnamed protein product [Protopolystoma xenopodis]|uniref:ELP1 first N-terminal beta-propeller domain-containing protein n=1 Tax=Protopolystoma xenopodis TaxID=117903 RepID=A0A3S5AGM7_9PLAT|nr:unnamed protein product [Protopolystoma xenopodis]